MHASNTAADWTHFERLKIVISSLLHRGILYEAMIET